MPIPRAVARFNQRVFNRMAVHVAPVLHDESRAGIRPLERTVLGWLRVADFPVPDRVG